MIVAHFPDQVRAVLVVSQLFKGFRCLLVLTGFGKLHGLFIILFRDDQFRYQHHGSNYDHSRSGKDDGPSHEIEGTVGRGVLGAALGAFVGVIPYMIVSMIADFHMAALCFPAGMLAVVFYAMLRGVRSKGTGMGICMAVSSVVSVVFMALGMILSYVNDTTDFSAAFSYLTDKQLTFFLVNVVFSILGSIFGAFFMISVMNKYVDR